MNSVCSVEEVKEGRGKRVIIGDEEIVLFKVDGTICAIANLCPHQRFRKLHEGMFENGIVTCPMHGWAYDVRTGISTNASGRVRTYKTEMRNGYIYIIDPLNQ
jgi:nitrite reductase/ring-hydroxylating ferredoxin subunit